MQNDTKKKLNDQKQVSIKYGNKTKRKKQKLKHHTNRTDKTKISTKTWKTNTKEAQMTKKRDAECSEIYWKWQQRHKVMLKRNKKLQKICKATTKKELERKMNAAKPQGNRQKRDTT